MKVNILIRALILSWLLSCNSVEENKTTVNDSVVTKSDPGSLIYGLDISNYQGDEIDFLNKKKDSLFFVICKATEGLTVTDSTFDRNWKAIQGKGFIKGAYHFYHCTDDPVRQAEYFSSVIGPLSKDDFPPVIDFESQ